MRFTFTSVCIGLFMMTFNTNAGADSLESLLMPGPLIEGHKKLEDDCSNCHKPLGNIPQRTLCLACHEDIKADIESTTGLHGHQPQRLSDSVSYPVRVNDNVNLFFVRSNIRSR